MSTLPWPSVKHGTASVFVLRRTEGIAEVALLWHEGLGRWLVPGGHIETNETAADAAHREVIEEIGCEITLYDASAVQLEEARGERPNAMPLAVVEEVIPAGAGQAAHVHVDHLFVAALHPASRGDARGETAPRWARLEELARLEMFRITREIGEMLLRPTSEIGRAVLVAGVGD